MKKSELKSIIRECLTEAILEDSLLSSVIQESINGVLNSNILEHRIRTMLNEESGKSLHPFGNVMENKSYNRNKSLSYDPYSEVNVDKNVVVENKVEKTSSTRSEIGFSERFPGIENNQVSEDQIKMLFGK